MDGDGRRKLAGRDGKRQGGSGGVEMEVVGKGRKERDDDDRKGHRVAGWEDPERGRGVVREGNEE